MKIPLSSVVSTEMSREFATVDTTQDSRFLSKFIASKDLATVDLGETCVRISDMDTKLLLKKLDAALAQLSAMRVELEAGDVKYPPSIEAEAAKGICHFCKKPINKGKEVRGLHEACNQFLVRERKEGNTTESELIKKGQIGPPSKGGRKKKHDLSQQAVADAVDLDGEKAQRKQQRKSARKIDTKP